MCKIKSIIIFLFFLFFTVPFFLTAQILTLNIGFGGSLGFDFANNTTNTSTTNSGVSGSTYYYINNNKYFDVPLDTFMTIDLRYIEASIGFWWGGRTINTNYEGTWTVGIPGNKGNSKNGGLIGGWVWSIFLKTPPLGLMSWFPVFGIESRILDWVSPGEDMNTDIFVDNSHSWNNLWYKFGFGFDGLINKNLFSRIEFLSGIRISNQYENQLKNVDGNSVNGFPLSFSIRLIFYRNINNRNPNNMERTSNIEINDKKIIDIERIPDSEITDKKIIDTEETESVKK